MAISAILSTAGFAADFIGGRKARKAERRRIRRFEKNLARNTEERVALERIARGEARVSLSESKDLFDNAVRGLSLQGTAASRRLLERINQSTAENNARLRRRGLQGSSGAATQQAILAREQYRGAMDASAQRAGGIADLRVRQEGHEANLRRDIQSSFRREGEIRGQAGRELRRSLENTQVRRASVTQGLSLLGAELDAVFSRRKKKQGARRDGRSSNDYPGYEPELTLGSRRSVARTLS